MKNGDIGLIHRRGKPSYLPPPTFRCLKSFFTMKTVTARAKLSNQDPGFDLFGPLCIAGDPCAAGLIPELLSLGEFHIS